MSSSLIEHIRGSWRILVKEIAAFGVVGALGFVIDIGLFNVFLHTLHSAVVAKTISTTVATVVTYVGNRYLSFSHRARSKLGREAGFFFVINLIALVFSVLILWLFSHPFGYQNDQFVLNVVNLFTIGLGTVFRFWAYKRFVFLHPDRVAAGLPDDDPIDYDAPRTTHRAGHHAEHPGPDTAQTTQPGPQDESDRIAQTG
ncbi:MAG TPA: GtrA family protein [Jatrophihabitans sp.]|nr:GtrA family protein [Jatrophihabitans sp.]